MVHPSTLCYVAPSLSQWNDSAMLMNNTSNGSISSQDEYTTLYSFEGMCVNLYAVINILYVSI